MQNVNEENKLKEMKYRHYGSKSFDPSLFENVKNENNWVKPLGGFWLSPINSSYFTWEDFCKGENFKVETLSEYADFKIKKDARVLILNTIESIKNQPEKYYNNNQGFTSFVRFNYESIAKDYDAIFYDEISFDIRMAMYGWDCTTLLVMNPDILEEIK